MILTYICDLDPHLNNGLRLASAYAAVVRLPTTAVLLVIIQILIEYYSRLFTV